MVELTGKTLTRVFLEQAALRGDGVALREKDFGYWNNYSWNDYYDHVRKVALGLSKIGLHKEEVIILIGDNIPEMLFVALGAQSIGAISAAIYQTTMPEDGCPRCT